MRRMRLAGFALLGGSAVAIAGAAVTGFVAASQGWDRGTAIGVVSGLALIAEICFWLGGGILGLSIIRRRRDAFARLAFWRRSS